MRSLSLVMSECSLSGHGQGHVSNFYIVNLENFTTASRLYTGDIHNSTVVGLFMTLIRQWKRLTHASRLRAHVYYHMPYKTDGSRCWLGTESGGAAAHLNSLQLHNFDLFMTCRTALLRGNWQDFNWHDASRDSSAIAELLVNAGHPYVHAALLLCLTFWGFIFSPKSLINNIIEVERKVS